MFNSLPTFFLLKSMYFFKFWKISLFQHLSPKIFFWDLFISNYQLLVQYFYIIPNVRNFQFGLCSIHIFSLFFFLFVISLTDTNDSQYSRKRRVNHYFSCFPLPPAHEYAFNSSRFLPLLFNRSICNYRTNSRWWQISLEICILLGFSWMQLRRSYWYLKVTLWEFELIPNYHLSTTKRTA